MKLRFPVVSLSILVGLGASSPAHAFADGVLDSDNAYSNAGTFIIRSGPGDGWPEVMTWCSGVLIAQDLVLTGTHCFAPFFEFANITVTFDPEPMDGLRSLRAGTQELEIVEHIPQPNLVRNANPKHGLAVFRLAKPANETYPDIHPASIPYEGLLDDLVAAGEDLPMSIAGYGFTLEPDPNGNPVWCSEPDCPYMAGDWWLGAYFPDCFYASRHYGEIPFLEIAWWWKDYFAFLQGDSCKIPCPDSENDPETRLCYQTPCPQATGGDSGAPVYWENPGGNDIVMGLVYDAWLDTRPGVLAARLDYPPMQKFLACVMIDDDAERFACLAGLCDEFDGQDRDTCLEWLPE